MTVLGIIDPPDCDEHGVPLDWEKCRTCGGSGKVVAKERSFGEWTDRCPVCGGHGSLKAAALDYAIAQAWDREVERWVATTGKHEDSYPFSRAEWKPRCEDCGHPMSEGTWEDLPDAIASTEDRDFYRLATGQQWGQVAVWQRHYSRCDRGCRHGGPGRLKLTPESPWDTGTIGGPVEPPSTFEASWRQVDVRTLGWPHDLRPEKLAVLCLRCYAQRTKI